MTAQAKLQAFRLGFATFLACLLTSALFFAPVLATHLDFGHRHPPGTPPHVHTINGVLGGTLATAPLRAVRFSLSARFVMPPHALTLPHSQSTLGPAIRAPPPDGTVPHAE
ncbi:MAG TPA: hypothetical protein VF171_09655 [Trueperaceae bacterium]